MKEFIGKKVIIRADRAGVFFGTLTEKDGQEVVLKDCRRIFYWDGAASISQLAKDGTSKPENCKFTVIVDEHRVAFPRLSRAGVQTDCQERRTPQ